MNYNEEWIHYLIPFLLCFFVGGTRTFTDSGSGSSLPIYYKTHRIRTDQLCPDLQESLKGKDVDTPNYPYKSVFRLADQVWKPQDPCVFESRGPRKQSTTTVVIKAIRAEFQQWNFSGAQPCPEHIKLRLPSQNTALGLFSRLGVPLCTVKKPTTAKYHPHVWQLTKQKMGISFAIYDNGSQFEDGNSRGSIEVSQQEIPWLQQQQKKEFSSSSDNNQNKYPKFVHIVFATFYDDLCSLRVQQYLVDPLKQHCNSSTGRFYALCGMYNCSEGERVMRQAGFWSESSRDREHEIHSLIDFLRSKPFKFGHEPTFLDFLFNLFRLMVMPIVFLMAYYVSRQLREKMANRHLLSQIRSLNNNERRIGVGRVGVNNLVERVPVGLNDHPTTSTILDDLPPPYESIITPPSYLEAITQLNKPELKSPARDTQWMEGQINVLSGITPITHTTNSIDDTLPSYNTAVNCNGNYNENIEHDVRTDVTSHPGLNDEIRFQPT